MKSHRALQLSHATLFLSILIVLVPAIILIHFTRPFSDDFCFANAARQQGVLGAIRNQYFTWQGRWLGNGFSYLADSIGAPRARYGFFLYCVFASLFASIVILARTLFVGITTRAAVAWTSCVLAIYLSRMPSPFETVDWLTGALENHLSIALMIVCFAGLLRRGRNGSSARRWELLLFPVLFAIVVAGHELYGAICLLLLAAGAYILWRTSSPRAALWTVCTAGAAVGLAVVMLAPGNAIRCRNYPDHGKLGPTAHAVVQEMRAFEQSGLDVTLWLAGVLFVCSTSSATVEPTWRIFQLKRPISFAVTVTAIAAAGALVAPAWALGSFMPGRTQDACFLLMILSFFFFAQMVYWHLRRNGWLSGPPHPDAHRFILGLGAGALGVAILCGPNVMVVLYDCAIAGRRFTRAIDNRTALLDSAARQSSQADVVLPPIQIYPKSFPAAGWDIQPEATDWVNKAVATFYGVRSVRISVPTTAPVLETKNGTRISPTP